MPILTLWATVVAERFFHPHDLALTLGRAVAVSRARVEDHRIVPKGCCCDQDIRRPCNRHEMASGFLLHTPIRLKPNAGGELRAALRVLPTKGHGITDQYFPLNPAEVERYLSRAFGSRIAEVREAMRELASRYDPPELNRTGLHLYEQFRPEVPRDQNACTTQLVLKVKKILAAA